MPLANIPKGFLLSNKPVVLWIHDPGSIYTHDAVVNPEMFPHFRDGQLLRIHCPLHNIPQQQTGKQPQIKQQLAKQNTLTHTQDQLDLSTQHCNSQSQQNVQSEQGTASNELVENSILQSDSVVVKGYTVDKENLSKQQQLQVSISKDIADRFNLRSRQEVYIELIEPFQVTLDHVEIAFKEQYLGRSDMWRFQQYLRGTCVYAEKKVLFAGSIKATTKRLFVNSEQVASGYISKTTRVIFRSASAKFFLFIQMSKEMWEFDEDGELYFEKAVSNFLPDLFSLWKEEGTNHVVSIVLFTRVYYETKIDDPLIIQSSDGRFYKDFYKVIADWETNDDWMTVINTLKQEQLTFQPNVLLKSKDGRTLVQGQISTSLEGNILEAINLALNPFDKHYVDRDLMRTGLSLIVITPGVGKFWVNKKLLRLTNERMTDNGIAMDLICLSPTPLHITPLMCYMGAPLINESANTTTTLDKALHRGGIHKAPFAGNSPDKAANNTGTNQKLEMIDPLYRDSTDAPTQVYYASPHWLDCSFYSHDAGGFLRLDKFKPKCKMHELQMMGIMEHDICDSSVPYLPNKNDPKEIHKRTIKPQRSSSSLNDRIRSSDEHKHSYLNGDKYLSTSANYIRRSSIATHMEVAKAIQSNVEKVADFQNKYDDSVFKIMSDSRFSKRSIHANTGKSGKPGQSTRNSFDGIERPDVSISTDSLQRNKSITIWHHSGDQRRVSSITTHSQHNGIKSHFDHISTRKDDKNTVDSSKISPTYNGKEDMSIHQHRMIRKSTLNSMENKHPLNITSNLQQQQLHHPSSLQVNNHDDEFTTISSSTIEPVPINTKGFRSEANRKTLSQSPRQVGSLPSIHRQSESSDLVRTSFGTNRLSPSQNSNRTNPFKHILINPCDPSDNQDLYTSHLRSWKYALPTLQPCEEPVVHWRSLSTPACLPLTTDYFPSNEELSSLYNHYMYTVSASEDANLYQAGDRTLSEHVKTKHLLIEMLCQRLAQGFQIIVDDYNNYHYPKAGMLKRDSTYSILGKGLANAKDLSARKDIDSGFSMKRGSSPSNNDVMLSNLELHAHKNLMSNDARVLNGTQTDENNMWKNMVWWLSMGHQVHQLTFDLSGQNVEVRRFVKMTKFDESKISYRCAIWPKNMPTYRHKDISFNYPSLHYQWNYLDHLVAGYQDELTDNLRFWRARFIAIPRETLPNNMNHSTIHDHLDEEEKRIALFELWIQSLRKAKWLTPEEKEERKKKNEIGFPELGIKLTTMDASAYLASDMIKTTLCAPTADSKLYGSILSSINMGQTFTIDSKTKDIAFGMQDPKCGVQIMDRYWHFQLFHDVFIGSEFIDWIVNQLEEIPTREMAVKFGNTLMKRTPPLFYSVTKRHTLLDGHYYYSLNEEFVIDKKKLLKFGHRKTYSSNDSGASSSVSTPTREKDMGHSDSFTNLRQTLTNQSNSSLKTTCFQMSQAIIIDVDPYKKSDRRETAILHYDTIHNPKNCFHFQLNWLGCTAQLVQELVQNWSRQAERCGLKLVEGSVDQAFEDFENDNPFQCPVPITMVVPPPSVEELMTASKIPVPAQFYEIALVRHFDFILDMEADSNFMRAKLEGIELEYSYLKGVYKYDQYIHQSGVSFIQIRPQNLGFFWINNRLYTNHTPALIANRRQPIWHPDVLRAHFQERCNDKQWLTEFWELTRSRFLDGHKDDLNAWVFENSEVVDNEPTELVKESMSKSVAGLSTHVGSHKFSAPPYGAVSPTSPLTKNNSNSFSSSVDSFSNVTTDSHSITEIITALKK